jgi:hypothetical protein
MTTKLEYSQIGSNDYLKVSMKSVCPECDKYNYVQDTIPVKELLRLAAEIVDSSSFYMDLFNSRLL